MIFWIWIGMKKTGFKIQIQNPILYMYMDCQSQSNPPNWIAIRIEQSSNLIQQYPGLFLRQHEQLSTKVREIRQS